jgi:hypothetical protein
MQWQDVGLFSASCVLNLRSILKINKDTLNDSSKSDGFVLFHLQVRTALPKSQTWTPPAQGVKRSNSQRWKKGRPITCHHPVARKYLPLVEFRLVKHCSDAGLAIERR